MPFGIPSILFWERIFTMYVFTDCRISQQAREALCAYGHTLVSCAPHPDFDPAIASHPDMLLFPAEGVIFVHRAHADFARQFPIHPITGAPARFYPHDVLLNAVQIGNYLLCKPDATAKEVLQYAREQNLTVLSVRQGYAKCNLCVVSEHAAITEDASIANALRSVGIDVLQIEHGHVSLPPYPHGFIGGASGTDGTHVFFCGSLALHPDGARMADFCRSHGKIAVSLADHSLHDVGSLLFFS